MARRKRESLRKKKKWFGKGTRSRKVLFWSLIGVAALILLGIIAFYQLLNWLQGDGFRKTLSESIRNEMQAETVTVPENLTIQGDHITLPSLHVERKGMLYDVKAEHISSDVDRSSLWWDRHLKLNHFTVEDLTIAIDSGRKDEELPAVEKKEKSFWDCFSPIKTSITSLECKNTNLSFLLHGKDYSITGSSVSARPIDQGWQVDFVNGRLRTPLYYLENCGLSTKNNATLFITLDADGDPEKYDLQDCCIQLSPGELNIKGFYKVPDKRWKADLNVSNAKVERLLQKDWKKRIHGDLNGSKLELRGVGSRLQKAEGDIRLNSGKLETLPVISDLGLGGTRPFRTIDLSQAMCKVKYPYNDPDRGISDAWLFYDIDVRAKDENNPGKDLLRLKGSIIVGTDEEHSLGGTLCIGVSEDFLNRYGLPGNAALAKLFTGEGEAGFRWINVNISGTLDDPTQDLEARISVIMEELAGAALRNAGNSLLDFLSGGSRPAPKNSGKPADARPSGAPEAPAETQDGGGTILDEAADSAGKLLDTGLNLLPL